MASNAVRQAFRLYVGNLPWTVGHNELKQYFSKYGYVNGASVVFDKSSGLSRNYGFVSFSNKEGYNNATNVTNHILEGRNIRVQAANQN